MARKCLIEKTKRNIKKCAGARVSRMQLKTLINDRERPMEERFAAQMKLSQRSRNESPVRIRTRCALTGRPRAVYKRFGLSRIALRDLGSFGLIPGLKKVSW
jgi:small subunit ribosomal protein S14